MITPKDHQALWEKIRDFPLDDPGAFLPFSDKQAFNQNWSVSFTQRAIAEYKKFIFLCCVSEMGASPSQVVDEVWHLHLPYTTSCCPCTCCPVPGISLSVHLYRLWEDHPFLPERPGIPLFLPGLLPFPHGIAYPHPVPGEKAGAGRRQLSGGCFVLSAGSVLIRKAPGHAGRDPRPAEPVAAPAG